MIKIDLSKIASHKTPIFPEKSAKAGFPFDPLQPSPPPILTPQARTHQTTFALRPKRAMSRPRGPVPVVAASPRRTPSLRFASGTGALARPEAPDATRCERAPYWLLRASPQSEVASEGVAGWF
jgi:hypothetical protein